MQGNATKCNMLLSTEEKVITKADSAEIEDSQSEKLLAVIDDSQLSFEKYINNICSIKKVKLVAFFRVFPLMIFSQKNVLMNAF